MKRPSRAEAAKNRFEPLNIAAKRPKNSAPTSQFFCEIAGPMTTTVDARGGAFALKLALKSKAEA